MENQTRLYRLATALAHHRVSETCPAVYSAQVKAIAAFEKWLQQRAWLPKLTEAETLKLETKFVELVSDLVADAKEAASLPLRKGLVDTIHDHLMQTLPPERIAAVEAGQDLSAEEIAGSGVSSFSQALV